MKRLNSNYIFILVFIFFFINSSPIYAQIYADNQSGGVAGICLFCGITSGGNASDNNDNTYSTMIATVGALGYVYQRLSFPTDGVPGNYVSVVVENPVGLIDVSLLAGFSITTYNNGVSNNDTKSAASLLYLALLGGGNKMVIQFQATSNFDAIDIRLGGLLNVLGSLRVYYATISNTPLPVKFIYFTATPNKEFIKLNWAFEDNAPDSRNVIQKSTDGIAFKSIDTVKSSSLKEFVYLDQGKHYNQFAYYRVAHVESSGKVNYSDVVVVAFNTKEIVIYPNPFTDKLTIVKGNVENEDVSIIITNLEGRPVYSGNIQFADYYNLSELSDFESGIYNMQIITETQVNNTRLIKK